MTPRRHNQLQSLQELILLAILSNPSNKELTDLQEQYHILTWKLDNARLKTSPKQN